ncbi:MAG: molecular chaperone TorD family protein [Ectothiorhodospiraceae bacterium]|jgi:TorA maturation chaperone TorD|nr:molecular chaperone TorD family protein [Ectothiorhodospiraceae bacterium]
MQTHSCERIADEASIRDDGAGDIDIATKCEEYAARANLYRLFGGVFIEEPAGEFLANLRSNAVLAALAQMGAGFDEDFLNPAQADLEHALACEYTVMFATSGGLPPVESVRLQGGYHQAAHTAVKQFYREHGFTVKPGRFRVFEDNLGAELLFVAALLDRARAAAEAGDAAEDLRMVKSIRRFWVQHLGRWIRGYCSLVERASEHSFFREMARLTRHFAEMELEAMRLNVEDDDGGRLEHPVPEFKEQEGDGPVCGQLPSRG